MQSATNTAQPTENYYKWLLPLLFLLAGCIYCYTALTSFGYDDEYFNIRIVTENGLSRMVQIVQSSDIHPPLSYILNFIVYKILHSWQGVRLVSSLLFLAALAYTLVKTKNNTARLLLILLVGFNPAVLLWATSLRWYAYAIPVLLLLGTAPDYRKKYYWWYFFLLVLVLFYLGYIGFILFVPYFLSYWLNDKHTFYEKIKRMLAPVFAFFILYAFQLFIFITVHSKSNTGEHNKQVFDLKSSLSAILSSSFSNQGLFPLSAWGIASIAGAILLYILALFHFKRTNESKHWLVFSLSLVLMALTGVAGKIRNLLLLEPSRNLLLAQVYTQSKNWLAVIGLTLVMVGNIAGVRNVMSHTQTSKNAWNIPLDETLQTLNKLEAQPAREVYFTHSPTFVYYLTEAGKNLVSGYSGMYFDSSRIKTSIRKLKADTSSPYNLTFILTYRGQSIDAEYYDRMLQRMKQVHADSSRTRQIGADKEYALKQKYFKDYPPFEVTVVKFYGVKTIPKELEVWEKNQ